MGRTFLILFVAGMWASAPVAAHHSFAAHYFEDQTVSIEGELVEFEYRAPHSWVHVMAKDETGVLRKYSAEWANPNRLSQRGVTQESLKPGDRVAITGSPGRNPAERRIHLKSITRPADGWNWSGPGARR